jgi:V/A-type H+/Na+-transporting ATPase subunit E
MSLAAILEAICASGQAEISEIEGEAERQAAEILRKGRQEAQQRYESAYQAALEPAARERARILHQARLEALRLTGEIREALTDSALEQTRGHLARLRTDPAYPQVLKQLTQQALSELSGSETSHTLTFPRLEADPRDEALLESILDEIGLDLPVSYNLHCWGGIVAKSEDERVVVINTLEARLERATPYLRRYLAASFEEDSCQVLNTETHAYAP